MKILNVITSMDPKTGGPSQGLRNLSSFNLKLGLEVEVVCLDEVNQDYDVNDQVFIHKLGKGKTSFQYSPTLLKWLLLHIERFDYVSVHGIWQYHNYAVYKAIKILKKNNKKVPKVVIMPHGMLDPYFQKATDRKIKALRNELVWRITEKRAINAADAVFFTCEEELLLARNTFKGYQPRKDINVGYGIQRPPVYTPLMKTAFEEVCPQIKAKNYWLFISRIHPKKGIDLLIKAYSKLTDDNYSLPELVIAGPTSSAYAQQMVKKASNNNHIHFSGMLSGDSKWGAFYGCQAYLLPSHQENFGIAIVEAMACEKPVLITKNINIWREIEAGNGGWILDELNIDSIKKQLINISCHTDTALEIKGQHAFKTYQNKFDVEACATVFVATLHNL
ncbi:glycosyltransferase [Flavobacterium sp. LB2P6]|uniref:glycosyltransferase n=1 Tax=Flavobacterium sp. LB2P6 TaxID=3401714 RepID=UPI003AADABAF